MEVFQKDDKFYLSRNYFKNIKGYIFGINQKKFISDLSDKIKLKKSKNLKNALVEVFKDIRVDNSKKIIILFSPAAISFDCFKNFEARGLYFNKIIKRYIYAKKAFNYLSYYRWWKNLDKFILSLIITLFL